MKHMYESRNLECKSPYGAVPAGTEVRFSLYADRSTGIAEIHLFIAQDGNGREQHRIRMQWSGLRGADDRYCCTYRIPEPGLYWYYFYVRGQKETFYLSRGVGGASQPGPELTERFQITAYDEAHHVPAWFGEGITYHIFPDRFFRTAVPAAEGYLAPRTIHENWDDTPYFLPDASGEILNNDFFGGSLNGIREKLSYLASLHVRTLYLNPIFESFSNHRYDTGDYRKIDPMLGTEQDFAALCREADAYGIRVVLDGVFNHTGIDSLYFNGRGHYECVGACQSADSPYAQWYDFQEWPRKYSSWWGIYTLPQVNENDESYRRYIIGDQDSVIRRWLRLGAAGWRLDVADELPDNFIEELNRAAKEEKPDALVIGEVWEDASSKVAYGERRRYLQGGELDSVMNYPLRDAILRFLSGGEAGDFAESVETLRENYPRAVFYNLMNLIGTHDTPRILSVLGSESRVWELDKTARAGYTLSEREHVQGVRKLKMAAILQFSMPGSPCVYYGDEAGMQGYEDPLNRRTYPWGAEDEEILTFYRRLCAFRAESQALQQGELHFLRAENGLLAFSRMVPDEYLVIAVNRSVEEQRLQLPFAAVFDVLSGELLEDVEDGVRLPLAGESARIVRCAD